MIRKLSQGFTLIETLITMLMLGILLTIVVQMFSSQNRVNNNLLSFSELTADARMTTVRMNELLSQAAYIYPAGQTIALPGGVNVVTGKEAVAFLLASRTPYCTSAARTYCGVLYRIEARAGYESILGINGKLSPFVITERIYTGFNWAQLNTGAQTSRSWTALTLTNNTVGLVADAVDNVNTDLGSNLIVATRTSDYDRALQIGVPSNNANALVQAVRPRITLRILPDRSATREFSVFAQPIPRQGPLDN